MGKTSSILIAGANGYLGRQALLYFGKQGLRLVAACRGVERGALEGFLAENNLKVPVIDVDLGKEGDVAALVRATEQKLGSTPDAVLNTAGIFEMFPTVEATQEQVERIFNGNFTGNWFLLKHMIPGMKKKGYGRVVLISAAATMGPAGAAMGFYVASKSALNCVIQSTAAEMAKDGIKIHGVMPTIIDTPRNRADMPRADFSKWVSAETLMGVIGDLLSAESKAESGALIKVGK